MSSVFSLLSQAWAFYRKQPVLNSIILWMFFLPTAALDLIAWTVHQEESAGMLTLTLTDRGIALIAFFGTAVIASIVVTIWADACFLLIARRIVTGKAGRNRHSLRAVAHEGRRYIVPLLLTGILMGCFTIFWGLLLIVPGVLYAIRATFYHVVVVTEGVSYRAALRRSREAVYGHTWETFLRLLGLSIVLFIPVNIAQIAVSSLVSEERLALASAVFFDGLWSIAYTIFLLCLAFLYRELRDMPKPVRL